MIRQRLFATTLVEVTTPSVDAGSRHIASSSGVPQARTITIPGGRHYVFLSHRAQVTSTMHVFLDAG